MSSIEYEFHCPDCDEVIPLTTRQAGQEMICSACRNTCSAPRLGQLKQLPVIGGAEPEKNPYSPNTTGSGSQNKLFVFGLLLLVFGIGSAYGLQRYAQSQLIVDYNVEGAMDRMDPYVDELTQFEIAMLFDTMNVDKGLPEWKELPHVASTKQGNILMTIAYVLYGIGALGLISLISSFFFK